MNRIKNFLVALLILVIVAIASSANAAIPEKKRAIDWTDEDVIAYVNMTYETYLREAKFTSAEDAKTRVSTHLAAACQILRNEGIIYRFDIVAYTKKNEKASIIITIVHELNDDDFQMMFEIIKDDVKTSKVKA